MCDSLDFSSYYLYLGKLRLRGFLSGYSFLESERVWGVGVRFFKFLVCGFYGCFRFFVLVCFGEVFEFWF